MSRRRLKAVFRKELLHIVRDWRSLGMALAVPMALLMLFGYALTLDVDRIPTILYDQDGTAASRELAERLRGSRFFEVRSVRGGHPDVVRELDRGRALMAVVIPRGYARHVAAGENAKVQVLLDGSDSNTASIAAGYADAVVMAHAMELRGQWVERRGAGKLEPPADLRPRVLYNNALQSRNFIVPGLIAVILMIIASLLTSLTVAREWEIGTMEQLMVTPLRPIELMLGKTIPFALVGMFDLMLLTGLALFILSTLGAGLFMSTVSHTQQQAMMASFFFFQPAFMLSGFAFPIRNMPEPVQWLTYLNPLRYFMEIVRGVFLKGSGAGQLWPQLAALAAMGVTIVVLSALRFHKRLE
ncbi:MAG: ABC transporter permease [Bryobacteraceae bacterium]